MVKRTCHSDKYISRNTCALALWWQRNKMKRVQFFVSLILYIKTYKFISFWCIFLLNQKNTMKYPLEMVIKTFRRWQIKRQWCLWAYIRQKNIYLNKICFWQPHMQTHKVFGTERRGKRQHATYRFIHHSTMTTNFFYSLDNVFLSRLAVLFLDTNIVVVIGSCLVCARFFPSLSCQFAGSFRPVSSIQW